MADPCMNDALKMAFEFARDLDEQLITLATGIIALSVTFLKDVFKSHEHKLDRYLTISWFLYFMSIIFGIADFTMIVGNLVPTAENHCVPKIGLNMELFAGLQITAFVFATVAFITYGKRAISKRS